MMRSWVTRRHEQAASGVKLDQFSEQHEPGKVRDTGGLLQVVRDDDNRMIPLELMDGLLDFR
jgi:hypothetical protein